MSIFTKRVAFKPFEYPEVVEYKNAINHSYWLVSEWNFLGDVHDFKVNLTDIERNAVKNTLLAISQIEVSVKKFWTKLGDRFPKPEFEQVGVTCGESEVRHADAYSHLLQVLGLNEDFANVLEVPAIQGRVNYLSKFLNSQNTTDKDYTLTLTLFSIFIENVSLFSQFVIIKSFNKYKNVLKDIDNVVQATQKEEVIHAMLGMYLINEIKKENPEWFNDKFYTKINEACVKAYEAECGIIDWIFEDGELDFLSKDVVKEFIKQRLNESIKQIGGNDVFEIDQDKISELQWFEDEIHADVNTDFFYKRPVSYSKKLQAITAGDLF
jgi:ribonucleoside-diphosphate reductase beta chain